MLALTRRPGESIVIGDVTVTVVKVWGQNVRIAIDAPDGTPIRRETIKFTPKPKKGKGGAG